ncbi:MAG: peptidoglycan-binding protein [Alphaproteobacteria bacterium]|nr:peptidoglycan-binding protein [Alphaproteobacteria bacterium]
MSVSGLPIRINGVILYCAQVAYSVILDRSSSWQWGKREMAKIPSTRRYLLLTGAALAVAALGWTPSVVAGDAASRRVDKAARLREKRLIRRVQTALNAAGHDAGPADGIWGPRTSAAVSAFQESKNLEQTGQLGPRTLDALLP